MLFRSGWGKLDQPVRAGARLDLLDDARRHRGGRVGMANQPSHAEGAVDRSPGRLLEIELYKDVARKQRRLHHIAPARVAAFAPVARQIGSEALALKVEAGALFALGLGLGNIPARPRRRSEEHTSNSS